MTLLLSSNQGYGDGSWLDPVLSSFNMSSYPPKAMRGPTPPLHHNSHSATTVSSVSSGHTTSTSSLSESSGTSSFATVTGGGNRTTPAPPKKRESRAGTRKVSSLSAAALERKRANDREAQRTIRQRTKEHIENLERKVTELSAKNDQVDSVMQKNAALESELSQLRYKLRMMEERLMYGNQDMRNTSSSFTSTSDFPNGLGDGQAPTRSPTSSPGSAMSTFPNTTNHASSEAISRQPSVPVLSAPNTNMVLGWQTYNQSSSTPMSEQVTSPSYNTETDQYIMNRSMNRIDRPVVPVMMSTPATTAYSDTDSYRTMYSQENQSKSDPQVHATQNNMYGDYSRNYHVSSVMKSTLDVPQPQSLPMAQPGHGEYMHTPSAPVTQAWAPSADYQPHAHH